MKKVYEVVKRLSQYELIGKDYLGRERRIQSNVNVNIGDTVITSNGIVIGLTKKETQQIFGV